VILLDWWLPGVDGLTLLQRFRAGGGTAPVLFLTARDAVAERVRGLDAGADDYLCKPFSFEELLARVRALARRREPSAATTLVFGDVQVDLMTHRAERSGHRLDLTAKEYALLVFFLRHPEEVLSQTRIYEQVWDERYDGLSNTLVVHVMELRRKLEAHGPRLLHTLRNRGYVFGAAKGTNEPDHRLSAFSLAALAAVLVGFSFALYGLAFVHLHQQDRERLATALDTLAAAVEIHPDCVEWEPDVRRLRVGGERTDVRWAVTTVNGKISNDRRICRTRIFTILRPNTTPTIGNPINGGCIPNGSIMPCRTLRPIPKRPPNFRTSI